MKKGVAFSVLDSEANIVDGANEILKVRQNQQRPYGVDDK